MLPKITVEADADVAPGLDGLDQLEKGYDRVGDASLKAGAKTSKFDTGMRRSKGGTTAFGRGVQNASYQLGDFAVQVGAGTSASIALGQQLPQLLGGFGILGAVLGAVVAIAVPLTRVFKDMGESGSGLSSMLGTLEPLVGRLAEAFRTLAEWGVTAAELIINNLDRILITAATFAGFMATKWVVSFAAATAANLSFKASLKLVKAAIISTGIGVLVVGAGELFYQFSRLAQAAGGWAQAFELVKGALGELIDNYKTVLPAMVTIAKGVGVGIYNGIAAGLMMIKDAVQKYLVEPIMKGLNFIIDAMNSIVDTGISRLTLPSERTTLLRSGSDRPEPVQTGAQMIAQGVAQLGDATAGLENVQKIKDLLASIKDENLTIPDLLGAGGADDEKGGKGKTAKEKLDEELTDMEKRVKEHFDRIKDLTTGGLSDKLGAWGDYFNNLVNMSGSQNKKLFAIAKSAQAGQSLIDAWGAYTKVLNDPALVGQPFTRVAAAAQVLAAGLGAVNAIKSINENGSGGGGSGGGAGSQSSSAAETGPTQSVYVNLQGDSFSKASVAGLLEQIQSQLDRGGRLVFE